MPLGVFSNCIAPIARGLYAAGISPEWVLAAMFASPAVNMVVLAITFVVVPTATGLVETGDSAASDFGFRPRRIPR
jgi:uncharacterized membrane protein YraQ (UPF0718 family)